MIDSPFPIPRPHPPKEEKDEALVQNESNVVPVSLNSGEVRTFLVFRDLPYHYEHRAGNFPLLEIGTVIDFDARVPDLKCPAGIRDIKGAYQIVSKKFVYTTKRPGRIGLSQYLELFPANESMK
jgi:hypothetical protein